jgi:hypothetical protein
MLPWRRGWWSERLVEESAIKAVLEDRTDRGDGASLDQDAASAGGIDARIVVAPGQRQNAEAGAKALLGMRPWAAMTAWKNAAVEGPILSPAAISPPGVHLP